MSPVRPVFNDGAILGADDLTALAVIDRERDARHARHLHTPGVAAGLELTKEERSGTTGTYVEVTLQPGYAVDGTGRELVVGDALPVSPDRFLGDNPSPATSEGTTETLWHPVFIRGLDATATTTSGPVGCEAAAGPGRIEEDVEIEFGRPGDADADQPVPAADAGPGSGGWRVLVGFVKLDTALGRFVDAAPTADGVRVEYAGARAGLVAGVAGRVEIRTRGATRAGLPAVVLEESGGGSLVFGLHKGAGPIEALLTVDASGNVKAKGTVAGKLTAGAVRIVSGSAFDGTVLPLPSGITAQDVADGAVDVAVHVTPRLPDPGAAPPTATRFLPAECRVDEDRRVVCWGSWFQPGAANAPLDRPAACDYVVLVSVPEGGASCSPP